MLNLLTRIMKPNRASTPDTVTRTRGAGSTPGYNVTLPSPGFTSMASRLSGIFGGIFNYFTDTGEGYDGLKTLLLARNYAIADPIISSYIRTMQNYVVGHTGFTLQSRVSAFDDPAKNSKAKTDIENEWYKYASNPKFFDISGRLNATTFFRQALKNFLIEGEVVIRIYKTGEYGYKLQLLNYDSIDYLYSTPHIFNGVEVDATTTPIRYWIKDAYQQHIPVPAEEVIHVVNYFDSTQYRGISTLSSVIPVLKDINTYRKTEIAAAMAEATSVLTYESTADFGRAYEGASSPQDLANFRPRGAVGPDEGLASRAILEAYEASSIRVGTTAIEALPPGVHLNQIGSVHPNKSVSEFQKSIYKLLGAGLGVSYLTLMMDLDASTYSGGRQTSMLERPTYKFYRELMVNEIMEKIFVLIMPSIIKKLKLEKVDGNYDAYMEHQFSGHGWDYINPKDDMAATVQGLNEGLISYTEALGERSVDLEDHLKILKAEDELMAQYGFKRGSMSSLNTDTLVSADQPVSPEGAPQAPEAQAPAPQGQPAPAPPMPAPAPKN